MYFVFLKERGGKNAMKELMLFGSRSQRSSKRDDWNEREVRTGQQGRFDAETDDGGERTWRRRGQRNTRATVLEVLCAAK